MVVLLGSLENAAAMHQVAHCRPLPAEVAFPQDFPVLTDHEWQYSIGGWGGIAKGHSLRRRPVVLVHGNTRDAGDWDEHGMSVKQRFVEAGYSAQELWALSYNGKSSKFLPAQARCRTAAQINVPDLAAFLEAVSAYTGAEKLDIVAHSLGVVVVRKTLVEHPELAGRVVHIAAIAGPNHGTTVCRRAWLIWVIGWRQFSGCDEIAPGSAWLRSLNGPQGEREAMSPAKVMTIYDGTGTDPFYLRWLFAMPVRDQDSPALRGVDNRTFPGFTHDELRSHPAAVSRYLSFIQDDATP